MKGEKKVKELAALRFRIIILFAAVLVAIGYIAFALFKFNRLATDIITDNTPDNEEEEPEEPETDTPTADDTKQPSNEESATHIRAAG